MAFITPSVRAATWAEIRPDAACPAATRVTALIVEDTTEVGTHADAAFWDSTAANAPPDTARPCRASRFASIALALASRLATVPSGQPSCRAASLAVLPSRSHRTMTADTCPAGGSTPGRAGVAGRARGLVPPRLVRACPSPAFPAPSAWPWSPWPSAPSGGPRRTASCRPSLGDDRRRLADEDEEGGLEGVLGVVVVAEDAAADAPDHRAVPPHQGFQGRWLSAADEALQQLPIGQVRPFRQQGAAKVLDDLAHRLVAIRLLVRVSAPSTVGITRSSWFYPGFSLDRAGRAGRRRNRDRRASGSWSGRWVRPLAPQPRPYVVV